MSETNETRLLSGFLLFPDNDKRTAYLGDARVCGHQDQLVESRFRPFLTFTKLDAGIAEELIAAAADYEGSHEEAKQYFPV